MGSQRGAVALGKPDMPTAQWPADEGCYDAAAGTAAQVLERMRPVPFKGDLESQFRTMISASIGRGQTKRIQKKESGDE